jgi:ribosomal protein S18 acetylase RimI-like enzyme
MKKESNVSVRAAAARDAADLGRLGTLLISMHHDFDPERFLVTSPDTEEAYAAFLAGEIYKPASVVLVAEQAGTVLGYLYAVLEGPDYMALRGPSGVIHDLIVDPSRRGEGVGRMLLEAVLLELSTRGAPKVVLSTASGNSPAQRLFASKGFRPTMIEMTRELNVAQSSGV